MYFSRNKAQADNGLQFWHDIPLPADHHIITSGGQSVAVPNEGARSVLDIEEAQ